MITLRMGWVTALLVTCGFLSQSFAADTIDLDQANPDVWAEKSFDLAGDPVDGALDVSAPLTLISACQSQITRTSIWW